jgi:hypothetical protein
VADLVLVTLMIRHLIAIAASVVLMPSVACSSDGSDGEVVTPQETGLGVEMQKLLKAFSGRWTITQTNPEGVTSRGEEVWRAGAGGVPLVEEYRVRNVEGKELADFATFWWDAKAKKYQGLFCGDFLEQGCTPFAIEWSDNKVKMSGEYDSEGKRFAWKEVFELGANSFVQTLDIGLVGEELKRVATIHATKSPEPRGTPSQPPLSSLTRRCSQPLAAVLRMLRVD